MDSRTRPTALGGYEDWPAYLRSSDADMKDLDGLAAVLKIPSVPSAITVSTDAESVVRGVRTQEVSWQLGYGPRTKGYYLRPAGEYEALPAVLLMHCHSGNKWLGAERLVDLGAESTPEAIALRDAMYDGRAFATELASQGFAVLAHDTFGWGSRRFRLDPPPQRSARHLRGQEALWSEIGTEATEELRYNALAADHENTIAKASALIGTTFAGMVAHDDLAALNVLRSLEGADSSRVGTAGLSGGGGRSMMLAALSPAIRSNVISCMMTTFASLLPAYLDAHSWLMHTPGLWQFSDWPTVQYSEMTDRPRSLLVQYALADRLFPEQGMRDADSLLRANAPTNFDYSASWNEGDHALTVAMQDEVSQFFRDTLSSAENS